MNPKTKKLLTNLAILMVTIFLFFFILELTLRVFTSPPQSGRVEGLKIKDDLLGFRMPPNFSGQHAQPGFNVTITTNSLGLRNPEIGEKTKKRILILGDSAVWGFGVENNETFPSILDNLLSDYEIINAGMSAYSTKQELDYLKRDGIKLNPDTVILGFFIGNDFIDNAVRSENTSIRIEPSWFAKTKVAVRNNLRIYPFFINRLKKFYIVRLFLVKTGLANNEEFYQYRIYSINYPDVLKQSVNLTFEYITEMNSFCEENNITFILLLIPSRYQVDDDAWQFLLEYNHFKENEHDRRKPNKLIIPFAEQNNLTYIDLWEDLEGSKEQFYLENDVAHFNPVGHKFVAGRLAEKLRNTFAPNP